MCIRDRRYDNYHFAHYNLGRAYAAMELFTKAREEFERALQIHSTYVMAQDALKTVKRSVH